MSFLKTISFIDVLDVLVLATLIYQVLAIFRKTRATQLLVGLFYFGVLFIIAFLLGMSATIWVFEKLAGLLAIALLIIFQPELRNFFERAGRRGISMIGSTAPRREDLEIMLETIAQALEELSEEHTGALIVIERDINLTEYINTGERIDAEVRRDLLKTIFNKGTALHDGAVIISKGRIISARSFLPLSNNTDIPSHLGTRHRAALGITEISDAVSLVVSEETGHLSFYHAGKPAFRLSPNTLRHMVRGIILPSSERDVTYTQIVSEIGRYFRRQKSSPANTADEPSEPFAESVIAVSVVNENEDDETNELTDSEIDNQPD